MTTGDTAAAPALTPSQRLHLDVLGYVVIENTLSPGETSALVDAIYEIEEDFHAGGPIRAASRQGEAPEPGQLDDRPPGHFYSGQSRSFFRVDNIPHLGQCFLDYVAHPRLVAMATQVVGGPVRLEQSDAHIVRPEKDPEARATAGYGFHRGTFHGMGYTLDGLYHAAFVKTLTNLTHLGPDDGGTTVIAGSHKLDDAVIPAAIEAALADPERRLVHRVEAPAGSTLLFFETLVHSGGINLSGKDRVLVIGGYTPTMYQAWPGYDPVPALAPALTPEQRDLLYGLPRWLWRPAPATLGPSQTPSGR